MQFQMTQPADRPANNYLGSGVLHVVHCAGLPVLLTVFLWMTGTLRATPQQTCLALVLLQIGWASWLAWKAKPTAEKDFPLFTVVAGMYWLAYGLPLFWTGEWRVAIATEGVTRAMLLAVLGVACLNLGMRLGVCRRLRQSSTLDLRDTSFSPKYLIGVMLVGASVSYAPWLAYVFGFGFRQVFMIARGVLPLVSYSILLRRQLLRPVPLFERALLIFFVLATVVFGLASGWLGTGAVVMMVTGCVLLDTRFKIPKVALVLVFVYIIFLQPAKQQFRLTYWGTELQSGRTDRAAEWVSSSKQVWSNALTNPTPGAFRDMVFGSLGRFNLLQQTANVMDITPNTIPYQGGKMYSYLAVTLIPRAIWPSKPTVNDANRFYQLTYGLTAERDLDGVSISVGILTEAYISYGWLGAAAVMTLVGVFLDGVRSVFLARDSGVLMKGIGLGMMATFASPEAQMSQFLGGFVQQVLLVIFIMLPIAVVRRRDITASARRVIGRGMGVGAVQRELVRVPQQRQVAVDCE